MNKLIYFTLLVFVFIAIVLGIYNIDKQNVPRIAACEVRDFNYIKYIDQLRKARDKASERIVELNHNKPNIEKLKFYRSKVKHISTSIALVEKEVGAVGARHGCMDEPYELFMYEMGFPTFEAMRTREWNEMVVQSYQSANRVTFLRVLEVILSPLIALIVGLLLFFQNWRTNKKPNKKRK